LFTPFGVYDPEIMVEIRAIKSPIHIQPEWYFLAPYAILRAIPNKVGGVIAFVISVVGLSVLPWLKRGTQFLRKKYQMRTSLFVAVNLVLGFLGRCPVETPYLELRQYSRGLYFLLLLFG
jgi:ubiquinol-cytochrome c reductase cytochrome b subunit